MNEARGQSAGAAWKSLYTIGGAAGAFMAVFIPTTVVVFVVSPPPQTVADHFALFQTSKLLGLLGMDLLYLLGNLLMIPSFLALYVALRRTSESLMAISLTLLLVGVVALVVARPAFEMMALSDGYAAASTDAERAVFMAAGEAMWALYRGTAFQVHYVFGGIGFVLLAIVMLRSEVFGKAAGYAGLAAQVVAFGYYLPVIGVALATLSALLYWVWYILVAIRLLQLGRGDAAVP